MTKVCKALCKRHDDGALASQREQTRTLTIAASRITTRKLQLLTDRRWTAFPANEVAVEGTLSFGKETSREREPVDRESKRRLGLSKDFCKVSFASLAIDSSSKSSMIHPRVPIYLSPSSQRKRSLRLTLSIARYPTSGFDWTNSLKCLSKLCPASRIATAMLYAPHRCSQVYPVVLSSLLHRQFCSPSGALFRCPTTICTRGYRGRMTRVRVLRSRSISISPIRYLNSRQH